MATGYGDLGSRSSVGSSRSVSSRGRGFAPGRVPLGPGPSWGVGLSADSRVGSPDETTEVDITKRGRNSPALSARSGDTKRIRVGSSLPLSSSLPTSPTGSISGFDPRPLDDVSSITSPDLLWIRDRSSEPILYPASVEGPFIVLMESTVPGSNLGKYDSLTIAD